MPSIVCPAGTESTIAVHFPGASEENLRGIWLRVGDTGHVRTTASCSCCEAPDTPLFQVWSRPTPRSPLHVHYHFRQCLLKQLEESSNNQLLGTLHTVHSKRKMYEKRHTTRSMHKETSCHHKIQRRVRSTPTYHEYGVHAPRLAPASVTSPCGAFSAWTRAHLYYPSTQLASTETTEIFLLTFPSPSVRYDTCSVDTCISHAILP